MNEKIAIVNTIAGIMSVGNQVHSPRWKLRDPKTGNIVNKILVFLPVDEARDDEKHYIYYLLENSREGVEVEYYWDEKEGKLKNKKTKKPKLSEQFDHVDTRR